MRLCPGPWLQHFKEALYRREPAETVVEAEEEGGGRRCLRLGELQEDIAVITSGQKVCYITDVSFTAGNVAKITAFAAGVDHLFIETAFLEEDRRIAEKKNHLTARQAGEIAGKARVKLLTPFHFSPRYQGREHQLEAEAQGAYRMALNKSGGA
jgi:ribonuclease Z